MELAQIIEAGGTISVTVALAVWVMAERRDNQELWKIIESLVKLRLRQVEELQEDVFVELD